MPSLPCAVTLKPFTLDKRSMSRTASTKGRMSISPRSALNTRLVWSGMIRNTMRSSFGRPGMKNLSNLSSVTCSPCLYSTNL